MEPKKIVVIGGSAAGPKAAAKARRMDEHAEITIIQKGADLSMASCGYPYYVGGTFDDRNMLICTTTGVVRDPNFYINAKKIIARINTEATSIDCKAKKVHIKSSDGAEEDISYDKLILTTGATPIKPPIQGMDLDGITTLQSMEDADYLRNIRDEKKIKHAVIIGGGLIGIETCEALQLSDIKTSIVEMAPQLLSFLDPDMAKLVENHVKSKGTIVYTSNGLAEILGENGKVKAVRLQDGTEIPSDLVVMAIGVRPNSKIGKEAGLEIGTTGGLVVNEYMQTSDPDIYAAGDCIEITNQITGKKVHAPYGDLANLEGRVAGENVILGNTVTFSGTIQTGVCKIFDFAAGVTGLTEKTAPEGSVSVVNAGPDKPGFMMGKLLVSKMIVDKSSGKILGVQCVGLGDVSKQIAIWAVAIKGNLNVEDMVNADLPYAPPFSLALDHSIATAHLMQNKMKGRLKGISSTMVKDKLDKGEIPFLLDARGPDEFDVMRLGVGEKLIPLGALRKRLDELPDDKTQEIICLCKISLRGYEASLILEANGWTNVHVMEGGIMSWPFPREK